MPFHVLVTYIINLIRKSLQFEISSFASFINFHDASKQAFSQARKKLSPKVFTLLNKKLITEFYSDNDVKTFKGFRLFAVDGSTIRLPDSEELYDSFGSYSKKSDVLLAKTSVLYDVLNHVTLHAVLAPYRESEKNMAIKHFEELDALNNETTGNNYNDLLIFDRGYPSHFQMFLLRSKKKDFLFRVSDSIGEVKNVITSGKRDAIIDIVLTKDKLRRMPDFAKYSINLENKSIKVRVAIFDLSSGEKEILLTSLINQQEFSYDDLFALYMKRWDVEEHYKLYKCIADIENFSGESKLAVEQDFYATVFTCNVASLLAQEAQEELNLESADKQIKHTYKINRNLLIGTIKNEILNIFLGDYDLEQYCEKLKRRLKRALVAIRPGRSYSRTSSIQHCRHMLYKKNCL